MVIAIMSDSHDNLENVRRALDMIQNHRASMIIHCGDLVAPFTLRELARFPGPVHWVLGNNDGDPYMLTRISLTEFNTVEPHGALGRLSIEDTSIAFIHSEEMGYALAHTGDYDLVCCGHTHVHRLEKIKDTILLNPGDIMGKDGPGSLCLFDTAEQKVTQLKLTEDL